MVKTPVAIAGIVAIATIAALLIAVNSIDKIENIEVDVVQGVLKIQAQTITFDTDVGLVPVVIDSSAEPTKEKTENKIQGNKIISATYGFEITAPNSKIWAVENDQEYLEDLYSYLLYPGVNLVGEVWQTEPDENGFINNVLIFTEQHNRVSVEENMKIVKEFIYSLEQDGFTISDVDEYIDSEYDSAVLTYRMYGCDVLDDGTEDCYESLHIETFFKTDDNKLYNVRGQVNPFEGDSKAPNQITEELFDIMSTFTLIWVLNFMKI